MLYACAYVVSFPNQKPRSLIWKRDKWNRGLTAAAVRLALHALSLSSGGQGLCRAHHLGKLLTYIATGSFSKARVVSCLSTVVCCLARERKIRKSASRREVRRVAGPSSGSSWQLYVTTIYLYMLGTTTTLSMLFQVLELWLLVHLKECSC